MGEDEVSEGDEPKQGCCVWFAGCALHKGFPSEEVPLVS